MKVAITIQGEKGEFQCSVVADGEKGSILFYDKDAIISGQGKATISVSEVSGTKAKVIETTERYDKDGKLVEKIVREIPEDNVARICHTPWATYGTTISPGQIACINKAQCARRASEWSEYASGCCTHAVSSASTAKPSETHG